VLKRSELHRYQVSAIEFVKSQPKCGLFLDMGLGKTVASLTVASDFLDNFFINKILVIAPLRVANTVWKQEASKWQHLRHLNVDICTGSTCQRLSSLNSTADIHIINRENIPWLTSNVKWKWDMVIVDESSSFKNRQSKRFKALKKMTKYIKSIILLTGTPSPNGLMGLWSQLYLIDNGKRLGRTITGYRQRFFKSPGYMRYGYTINSGAHVEVKNLIKDVCVTMSAEDYLQLPDRIDLNEYVVLPDQAQAQYDELKKEFLLEVDKASVEACSAAVLVNKLLQVCNGSVYDENKVAHDIHSVKLVSLKEIIEDNPDENFLVAYNFKSDLIRIQQEFPHAVLLSKTGGELIEWNKGNIKMLLAHPASAGHGINAQFGGSVVVWFGLTWSLELYQQFNARLHRQGQSKPVRVIHIVAKGCLDEVVLEALGNKAESQDELLYYLKYNL